MGVKLTYFGMEAYETMPEENNELEGKALCHFPVVLCKKLLVCSRDMNFMQQSKKCSATEAWFLVLGR